MNYTTTNTASAKKAKTLQSRSLSSGVRLSEEQKMRIAQSYYNSVTVTKSHAGDAFSVTGRASRREYWRINLFVLCLTGSFAIILLLFGFLYGALSVIILGELMTYAVSVRRLHDLGLPGWLVITAPLGGLMWFVLIGCIRGTVGKNRYGKDPLEGTDEIDAPQVLMVENLGKAMVDIPGKEYKMCKYEVTQSLWRQVKGDAPSTFKGADHPVESVTWNACQEFLQKLNAMQEVRDSRLIYRLPTAEEWEHACCAGAVGKYCKLVDGTEVTDDSIGVVAWFDGNSCGTTHPVGQKKPNAFGLYDMQGNVWEWTQTADGEYRINCGGSYGDSAKYCESSCRSRNSPCYRGQHIGFRLCASVKSE